MYIIGSFNVTSVRDARKPIGFFFLPDFYARFTQTICYFHEIPEQQIKKKM